MLQLVKGQPLPKPERGWEWPLLAKIEVHARKPEGGVIKILFTPISIIPKGYEDENKTGITFLLPTPEYYPMTLLIDHEKNVWSIRRIYSDSDIEPVVGVEEAEIVILHYRYQRSQM